MSREDYLAIPPGAIMPGSMPKFRIYVRSPEGHYILWAMEGNEVTPARIGTLTESGRAEVYIELDEGFKYEKYLEDNLGSVLGNDTSTDEQKATLFSIVSTNVVKGAFERSLGLGMMTPDDDALARTARSLRNHGANPDGPDYTLVSTNMRMAEPLAAIGLVQLGRLEEFVERRNAIAARYNLPVIEDAAQSFGATQGGRRSGGVTQIGSTSFFPAKPLGCYGEGGALFADDDQLAWKMRAIRTHGGVTRHDHPLLGTNGRFDTLQAAVLLAKLPHFDWELKERHRIGARYSSALAGRAVVPAVAPGNTHVYAQYTIRVPNRDEVAGRMKAQGIPTGVYYPKCLHEQPVFAGAGYRAGDFPASEALAGKIISLPMFPELTAEEVDYVIANVLAWDGRTK